MGRFSSRRGSALIGTVGSFGRLTYRVIIDNHILPFMYYVHVGPECFILQEDNCGPHRAKSIATYLSNEEVTGMKWPAQSPDFNPIENIWGLMKSHLRKRAMHPNNPMHLFALLTISGIVHI